MIDSATPALVWARPAAQDRYPPKGSVALPLSPFSVCRPASMGHGHPSTTATQSTI
jgi:hypothetical protein